MEKYGPSSDITALDIVLQRVRREFPGRLQTQIDPLRAVRGGVPRRGHVSDTTLVALNYHDGSGSFPAVTACDGLCSNGQETYLTVDDKLDELDAFTVMAGTGYAAPMKEAGGMLRAVFAAFAATHHRDLTAEGKAKQVASLVQYYYPYLDYFFIPLLVPFDPTPGIRRARIFDVWENRGVYEEIPDYYSNGSGSVAAQPCLEERYEEYGGSAMNQERAIELAVRAVHAGAHMTHTANEPQHVKLVTPDGIVVVPPSTIQHILDTVVRPQCGRCTRIARRGGVR